MARGKTSQQPERARAVTSRCVLVLLLLLTLLAGPTSFSALAQSGQTIEALVDRAKTEMFTNPEGVLRDAERVAANGEREANPAERVRVVATAEWLQSQAKMRLGDIAGAKTIANRAIERLGDSPKPTKLLGDLLLTLGNINTIEGDVQSALKNMQTAHDVYQNIGHKRGQAMALQGLGNIYHQAGDYTSALKYFEQSESVYSPEPNLAFVFHSNHGNALSGLKKYADAEKQYNLALVSARKMGADEYITTVLFNIAETQFYQNKLGPAVNTINEALSYAQSPVIRTRLLSLKAYITLRNGELESAGKLIELAMQDVDLKDMTADLRDSHYYAYQIYSRLGRHELAAKHLDTVWHMDEDNAQIMTSTSAALMAARFDFAAQNAQISELKADRLEREAATQRLILLGVSLAALGLIIGLLLITRSRNAERKAKEGLAVTNVQLEKAMAAKMEFLATTSHEIRTPLNGILGMTQVMLTDRGLEDEARQRLGVVYSAGETMKALVDDILDVAKMENGNLSVEMEPVEVRHLLTDATQMWRIQAEQKGVEFSIDLAGCPDRIEGDPARLRQVIFNLLSNAMKFTAQGRIELKAHAISNDNGCTLQIAVSDSGIGIAPEWHEKIFEMFQQVDGGTTRTYGGSGLGLAICSRLIEAMDGTIRVESEPGVGSTFIVELPLNQVSLAECEIIAHGGEVERKVILIVEANPLTRGLYKAMLADQFDEVAFVSSLEEATAYMAENSVDHLLVDDVSAGNDTAQLSDLAQKNNAFLTLASNVANDDLPEGVSSRVGKPVKKDELLAAVRR